MNIDDMGLLNEIMEDFSSADSIYQWTNYWKEASNNLLAFLKTNGLQDFRRNKDPLLSPGGTLRRFGATDDIDGVDPVMERFRLTANHKSRFAVSLEKISMSLVGNPEYFEVNGNYYSQSFLNFYIRYAYVSRFCDLSQAIIVEIGPGSGKQAELIKKAHPEATILLFDIAPQIYISNQYLVNVFGNDVVVPYKEAKSLSADDIVKGKIYIFGNWQIEKFLNYKFDLLWNAASFQEMEPDVVENYLRHTKNAKYTYLMQRMQGQTEAHKKASGGVLKKTTISDYKSFMPDFYLMDLRTADLAMKELPKKYPYEDSIWVSKHKRPRMSVLERVMVLKTKLQIRFF